MTIVISGPTASKKSLLALQIAAKRDCAIINADALQIYQGLPILSAQPSCDDKKSALHFLYSHFQYDQNCSVVLWLKLVRDILTQLKSQNKLPIIVGGSGMYISKLFEGISPIPEIEPQIRAQAVAFYNDGRANFIKNLVAKGEDYSCIENLDKQRLTRVYEVLEQTEKSIFWWQNQPTQKIIDSGNFIHVNLAFNREEIYNNCNLRFTKMLDEGAIEEVAKFLENNPQDNFQITKTLGFFEIRDFLQQKITRQQMIEIATQKTRNYAKRQLTWFRNQCPEKIVFEDFSQAYDFLLK